MLAIFQHIVVVLAVSPSIYLSSVASFFPGSTPVFYRGRKTGTRSNIRTGIVSPLETGNIRTVVAMNGDTARETKAIFR